MSRKTRFGSPRKKPDSLRKYQPPNVGPILSCGHEEWAFGHCAHMFCPRYIESCPVHAIAQTGTECNLKEQNDVRKRHTAENGG